jgi:hypothetical protein
MERICNPLRNLSATLTSFMVSTESWRYYCQPLQMIAETCEDA